MADIFYERKFSPIGRSISILHTYINSTSWLSENQVGISQILKAFNRTVWHYSQYNAEYSFSQSQTSDIEIQNHKASILYIRSISGESFERLFVWRCMLSTRIFLQSGSKWNYYVCCLCTNENIIWNRFGDLDPLQVSLYHLLCCAVFCLIN